MDLKSIFILNFFYILIIYFNPVVEGDYPFGFCANPDCSEPISKGKTIIQYMSPDDTKISVEPNEEVLIYVKDYGPKKDLWGIKVRGDKGYITKTFIKETQLIVKRLVPATSEFKSSILVTDSYTVSSNLHVSQHHHQSSNSFADATAQSVQHSEQSYINSAPDVNQPNWNSFSENLQSSHISDSFHPSHNIFNDPASTFDESWSNHVPEQSSQFHNNFDSFSDAGRRSDYIAPSQTHIPEMQPPPFSSIDYDFLGSSSLLENSLNPEPSLDYFSSENLQFGSAPSGLDLQNLNMNPTSVHVNSPHVSDMHSSAPLDSFEDDISWTLAMLSDRGFDNTDMFVDQESHFSQSAEKFDLNQRSFSGVSSHLQDSTVQGSDTLHSALPINPSVTGEEKAILSDFPQSFQTVSVKNTDVATDNKVTVTQKQFVKENIEDSDSSELLAETDFEDNSKNTHLSADQDLMSVSKNLGTNDGTLKLQSSVTSQHNLLMSKDHQQPSSGDINSDTLLSSSKDFHSQHVQNSVEPSSVMQENSVEPSSVQQAKSVEPSSVQQAKSVEPSSVLQEKPVEPSSVQQEKPVEPSSVQQEKPVESSSVLQEKSVIFSSSFSDSIQTETKNTVNTRNSYVSTQSESASDMNKILDSSDKMNFTTSDSENENIISDLIAPLVNNDSENEISDSITPSVINNSEVNHEKEVSTESFLEQDILSNILDENNNEDFITEESVYSKQNTAPKINEIFMENDKQSGVENFLNTMDTSVMNEDLTTYQPRNLKGEFGTNEDQPSDSDGASDENTTNLESDSYNSSASWFDGIKSFVDSIMSWIPDPLYSALMDLRNKGISPRVPVFTALCGFMCILLIGFLVFIKEWSKESELSAQLTSIEKKAYTLSATNIILEEKLESFQNELATLKEALKKEKSLSENLKVEFENQAEELENTKSELESCLEALEALKDKENQYLTLINNHAREKEHYSEHKESLDKILKDHEDTIANLSDQLQERDNKLNDLEKEKEQFSILKADYEEKLALFDRNCNTLLQEAEVWNLRVNELTEKLNEERSLKEEMVVSLKEREAEVESLKELVETFKIFEEIEDPEEQAKTKEEKLQFFLNNSMIANQLKKEEEKNKYLDEQLGKEKNKILDMEVELLEAKSDIDKLKLSYNQALQDKAEAQTKLEVLTNYFKDKEIQLQRQLGAQEAVRQKTEEDASSAERRIILIEQENTSYKSQVASMKQEMEETERTLKSQIAAQEKKAHENWIAARAAERKLEDMKQEVTQLRQRLTLLEREQENFGPRDEIIRPVPKRIPGGNEEPGSQDMNISERGMFPPPYHERMPPPPMMLPPDRPLPPLLPPPIPPMFLPPMERHFRNPPWHMPPDPGANYRTTPPEFIPGRESTPPRGRPITDGDPGPHVSSPLTTDTRDSRNSTPPHLLPDFHDVPPQPGRPFFPPPHVGRPRFPVYQPYRRDAGLEPKKLDNSNEISSRGPQQPPNSEQWQQSRV